MVVTGVTDMPKLTYVQTMASHVTRSEYMSNQVVISLPRRMEMLRKKRNGSYRSEAKEEIVYE